MLALGFLDKISLLLLFGFSILIVAFPFTQLRDESILKDYAAIFVFPLLLSVTPFFLPPGSSSAFAYINIIAVPAILLAVIIWFPSFTYQWSLPLQVVLLSVVIGILLTPYWTDKLLIMGRYIILSALIISLVTAGWLFKKKTAHLAWVFIAFGCALLALLIGRPWLYLTAVISAMMLMFQYILSELNTQLTHRIQQAETRISNWDRTVRNEVLRRTLEIERINQRLAETARTDALTGVLNKAAILEEIDMIINQNKDARFTVLLFDIDNFKEINDQQGHLFGDEVIQQVTNLAAASIRSRDRLGRYGGDEFIILLPQTGLKDALYVGKRLGQKVADELHPCTLSIGIAVYPTDGNTTQDLLNKADNGLYESKRRGKNTISYVGYEKMNY